MQPSTQDMNDLLYYKQQTESVGVGVVFPFHPQEHNKATLSLLKMNYFTLPAQSVIKC